MTDRQWTGTMFVAGEYKVGVVHEDWGTRAKVREDTCAGERAWWPVTDGKYDGGELHRTHRGQAEQYIVRQAFSTFMVIVFYVPT